MNSLFDDLEAPSLPWKDALRIASRIVPKRTTLPILQCIQFVVSGDAITLRATDLERAVSVSVSFGTSIPGPLRTPGTYLAPFDKAKAGYPLDKILEPDMGDYPALTEPGTLFPCPWISDLHVVGSVMAKDATRLSLNGVVVQPHGLTATDGHRLIHKAHDTGAPEFIVSRPLVELLGAIKEIPEALSLSDDGYKLHATFPWGWVAGKTVEGPYPNWKQVVPKSTTWTIRMPMAGIKGYLAQVPKGDNMQVEVVPMGEGYQIQWSKGFQDPQVLGYVGGIFESFSRIAVNAEYLRDMVSRLPGSVFTWKGNRMDQATIFGEGPDIYILTPLRFPKDG